MDMPTSAPVKPPKKETEKQRITRETKEERLQQKKLVAQEKQRLAHIHSLMYQRSCLPCKEYHDGRVAKPIVGTNLPTDFQAHENDELTEKLKSVIYNDDPKKILKSIGKLLGCDKTNILLLQRRQVTRNGAQVNVILYRFDYNPDFIAVLKDVGLGRWDSINTRAWSVDEDPEDEEDRPTEITQYFNDFFQYVIDLENISVYKNNQVVEVSDVGLPAFLKLPYHKSINIYLYTCFLKEVYKIEVANNNTIRLFNGEKFEVVHLKEKTGESTIIFTQSPFLIFEVFHGRTSTIILWSTLGMCIEEIGYKDNKSIKRALARYADACQRNDIPAFVLEKNILPQDVIIEQEGQRNIYGGDFKRFNHIRKVIEKSTDLTFACFLSDYATLIETGYDGAAANALAYVNTSDEKESYYNSLGDYFGEPNVCTIFDCYPIVFSRNYLEKTIGNNEEKFSELVIHELAHWLVAKDRQQESCLYGESHGLRWFMYATILMILLHNDYDSIKNRIYEDHMFSMEYERSKINAFTTFIDAAIYSYVIPWMQCNEVMVYSSSPYEIQEITNEIFSKNKDLIDGIFRSDVLDQSFLEKMVKSMPSYWGDVDDYYDEFNDNKTSKQRRAYKKFINKVQNYTDQWFKMHYIKDSKPPKYSAEFSPYHQSIFETNKKLIDDIQSPESLDDDELEQRLEQMPTFLETLDVSKISKLDLEK